MGTIWMVVHADEDTVFVLTLNRTIGQGECTEQELHRVRRLLPYSRHLMSTTRWLKLKYPNKSYLEQSFPCYFIGGKLKNDMQVVKPSSSRHLYKRYIDVPPNAHRRFLRTELFEKGMVVESINAFMGHWTNGEEPRGPLSTFNTPEYVGNLTRYIEPLLQELGFDCIGSRLGELS